MMQNITKFPTTECKIIFTCCSLSALASGVSGALSSSFLSSPPGIDGIDWERRKRGNRLKCLLFHLFYWNQGEAWTDVIDQECRKGGNQIAISQSHTYPINMNQENVHWTIIRYLLLVSGYYIPV